jgi:hypothetical protein
VLCQLSYAPSDGWGRNRTADTRVFSAVLYRLSYPAVIQRLAASARGLPAPGVGFEPTT